MYEVPRRHSEARCRWRPIAAGWGGNGLLMPRRVAVSGFLIATDFRDRSRRRRGRRIAFA
jgi:hypothetical protein